MDFFLSKMVSLNNVFQNTTNFASFLFPFDEFRGSKIKIPEGIHQIPEGIHQIPEGIHENRNPYYEKSVRLKLTKWRFNSTF